ncbi:hypothetical protein EHV15_29510 [Paenibacillus oralis]|uniref:Uncharacterized protein n=1 Tax=Paenibacillus oralis TaxID=2490856 RepID=A0A3P3UDR5_9BACL|nr:hypothetical protein [Paenibacillus oralis]RRJ66603.1 hypothetical protein EHV15_29510 [Paenibacillus oralis]
MNMQGGDTIKLCPKKKIRMRGHRIILLDSFQFSFLLDGAGGKQFDNFVLVFENGFHIFETIIRFKHGVDEVYYLKSGEIIEVKVETNDDLKTYHTKIANVLFNPYAVPSGQKVATISIPSANKQEIITIKTGEIAAYKFKEAD